MAKRRFIGGPWDGRWAETAEEVRYHLEQIGPMPPREAGRIEPHTPAVLETWHYDRFTIIAGLFSIEVWALRGMTEAEVLLRLVQHYRPPAPDPRDG